MDLNRKAQYLRKKISNPLRQETNQIFQCKSSEEQRDLRRVASLTCLSYWTILKEALMPWLPTMNLLIDYSCWWFWPFVRVLVTYSLNFLSPVLHIVKINTLIKILLTMSLWWVDGGCAKLFPYQTQLLSCWVELWFRYTASASDIKDLCKQSNVVGSLW